MLFSAHGLEGLDVLRPTVQPKPGKKPSKRSGASMGNVQRVLFDPKSSRAVGYQVKPKPWFYLVERRPRYLALDAAAVKNDGLRLPKDQRKAWGSAAAKRLGFGSWDESVQWRNMPVRAESGMPVGAIKDVVFAEDGEVRSIELSGGVTSDVALGIRKVERDDIIGFDGQCIRITDAAASADFEGGVAAVAGRGTAVATDAAGKAAVAAGKAAGTAVAYGKSAAKVAANSETGKKAVSWLKKASAATLDAMKLPEDDE